MYNSQAFFEFINSQDVLVSIIIPCYNKEPYITESINCALKQTYPCLEVLVVDDGSTDNSVTTAKSALAKAPRHISTNILTKPNSGISDTRNFAISQAQGRLILTLDGDDIMDESFVAQAISVMRQQQRNLVHCNVELFGHKSDSWNPEPYDPIEIRYNNRIPTLVLYDRELWRENGGYKPAFVFNEDWEFFLNASSRGLLVGRIDAPLFKYRVTEDGLANNYIQDTWEYSVSLVATANHRLYAVEEIAWSTAQLSKMPVRWKERFEKQILIHSNEWLLHHWLGLAASGTGEIENTIRYLNTAIQLAPADEWQPQFKLAELAIALGDRGAAQQLLSICRLKRPDCKRFEDLWF